VEFHFFGWAHTRGDGIVYLPKEKIVCTGDVVVNGDYNYLEHGNVANWPRVIEKIQKLGATTVLPGHGLPGSKDLLEGQKQFFNELEKAVKNAMKSGKKLGEIVQKDGGKITGTTIKLPGSVNNWISDKPLFDSVSLASQVEAVYQEIKQGKPHGEIVGGK
jgi:glyoxylase-like metal-dependent hydrolase (beta-lactamase superfamily II)